jgi:hypothetical protein
LFGFPKEKKASYAGLWVWESGETLYVSCANTPDLLIHIIVLP